MPRAPAPNDAPSAAPDAAVAAAPASDAEQAEEVFRTLDRGVHAWAGQMTGGLSLIALGQAWADWATHLALSPGKQAELAWKAARKTTRLGLSIQRELTCPDRAEPCIAPLPQDRRFAAPEWRGLPWRAQAEAFLLTQQWWHNATSDVPGLSAQNAGLVQFFARQWLDMAAPSNFLATNPTLLRQTMAEGGANLIRGARHLAEDATALAAGRPLPGPTLRPGREMAASPGAVILRNRLIEVIRYLPSASAPRRRPILVVPAWIMKYYILDLTPAQSLIGWLVGLGHPVYAISWKNPDAGDRDLGFEDYLTLGLETALKTVCADSGAEAVDGLGYCLGGTLLAIAAADLARRGDRRLASLTLLAAQLDFAEAGELRLFATAPQIELIEDMMWQTGYLDQRRMAGAFNMLRAQDLIWSRLTRRYLMGRRGRASAFDAWSMDATRMPWRMHAQYLRRFYLDNALSTGRLMCHGAPVELDTIRAPLFVVATERDHIAPWRSVWQTLHLIDTPARFVLASGGHNTGIIAPPGHPQASYRMFSRKVHVGLPDPTRWAAEAPQTAGSWWPAWARWLHAQSPVSAGDSAPGPKAGALPALGPAPGQYVLMR